MSLQGNLCYDITANIRTVSGNILRKDQRMMSFLKKKVQKFRKIKEEIEEEDRENLETAETPEVLDGQQEKFWARLGMRRRSARRHRLLVIGAVCLLSIAGMLFLYLHVGTTYSVLREEKRTDISGTVYAELGDNLLKYSSDGVTCMSDEETVLWNSTFSMQSPMIDISGTTAVLADKKGTQVYVFDESGTLGQFQTSLPIEKVCVANQGVVAAVLSDGDVTWINFYDTQGNEIAKNRTSLGDSGYPLDIALSPDGMKIMVSYLRVTQGIMNTKICFYDFDSVGQAEINNLVASETYENVVAPETYFIDRETSVAFLSNGFSLFQGKQVPEQKKKVEFDEEILSVFHDGDYFGFIFRSDKEKHKYKAQLYNRTGKQIMKTYFDLDYKKVKFGGDDLILFNEKEFEIYNTGGRKKFSGSYDKAIEDIIRVSGFRKYMVLSRGYVSTIRLR